MWMNHRCASKCCVDIEKYLAQTIHGSPCIVDQSRAFASHFKPWVFSFTTSFTIFLSVRCNYQVCNIERLLCHGWENMLVLWRMSMPGHTKPISCFKHYQYRARTFKGEDFLWYGTAYCCLHACVVCVY